MLGRTQVPGRIVERERVLRPCALATSSRMLETRLPPNDNSTARNGSIPDHLAISPYYAAQPNRERLRICWMRHVSGPIAALRRSPPGDHPRDAVDPDTCREPTWPRSRRVMDCEELKPGRPGAVHASTPARQHPSTPVRLQPATQGPESPRLRHRHRSSTNTPPPQSITSRRLARSTPIANHRTKRTRCRQPPPAPRDAPNDGLGVTAGRDLPSALRPPGR